METGKRALDPQALESVQGASGIPDAARSFVMWSAVPTGLSQQSNRVGMPGSVQES